MYASKCSVIFSLMVCPSNAVVRVYMKSKTGNINSKTAPETPLVQKWLEVKEANKKLEHEKQGLIHQYRQVAKDKENYKTKFHNLFDLNAKVSKKSLKQEEDLMKIRNALTDQHVLASQSSNSSVDEMVKAISDLIKELSLKNYYRQYVAELNKNNEWATEKKRLIKFERLHNNLTKKAERLQSRLSKTVDHQKQQIIHFQNELQTQTASDKKEIEHWRSQFQTANSDVYSLKEKNNTLQQDINRYSHLEQDYESLRSQLKDAHDSIDIKQAENAALVKILEETRSQHNHHAQKSVADELQKQLESQTDQFNKNQAKHSEKINKLNEVVSTLRSEKETIEAQYQQSFLDYQKSVDEHHAKQQNEVQDLRRELNLAKETQKESERIQSDLTGRCETLRKEKLREAFRSMKVESEADLSKKQLDLAKSSQRQLEQLVEQTKQMQETTDFEMTTLQNENLSLQQKVKELETQQTELEEKLEARVTGDGDQNSDFQHEVQDLRRELNLAKETQKESERIQSVADELKNKLELKQDEFTTTVKLLQEEVNSKDSHNQVHINKLAEQEKQLKEHIAAIDEQAKENSSLKQELEDSRSREDLEYKKIDDAKTLVVINLQNFAEQGCPSKVVQETSTGGRKVSKKVLEQMAAEYAFTDSESCISDTDRHPSIKIPNPMDEQKKSLGFDGEVGKMYDKTQADGGMLLPSAAWGSDHIDDVRHESSGTAVDLLSRDEPSDEFDHDFQNRPERKKTSFATHARGFIGNTIEDAIMSHRSNGFYGIASAATDVSACSDLSINRRQRFNIFGYDGDDIGDGFTLLKHKAKSKIRGAIQRTQNNEVPLSNFQDFSRVVFQKQDDQIRQYVNSGYPVTTEIVQQTITKSDYDGLKYLLDNGGVITKTHVQELFCTVLNNNSKVSKYVSYIASKHRKIVHEVSREVGISEVKMSLLRSGKQIYDKFSQFCSDKDPLYSMIFRGSGKEEILPYLSRDKFSDERKETLMNGAVASQRIPIVQLLLEHRYPVTENIMIVAVSTENIDLVKCLVDHRSVADRGARVNVTRDVVTAAVATGNLNLIKYLIDICGSIGKDSFGWSLNTITEKCSAIKRIPNTTDIGTIIKRYFGQYEKFVKYVIGQYDNEADVIDIIKTQAMKIAAQQNDSEATSRIDTLLWHGHVLTSEVLSAAVKKKTNDHMVDYLISLCDSTMSHGDVIRSIEIEIDLKKYIAFLKLQTNKDKPDYNELVSEVVVVGGSMLQKFRRSAGDLIAVAIHEKALHQEICREKAVTKNVKMLVEHELCKSVPDYIVAEAVQFDQHDLGLYLIQTKGTASANVMYQALRSGNIQAAMALAARKHENEDIVNEDVLKLAVARPEDYLLKYIFELPSQKTLRNICTKRIWVQANRTSEQAKIDYLRDAYATLGKSDLLIDVLDESSEVEDHNAANQSDFTSGPDSDILQQRQAKVLREKAIGLRKKMLGASDSETATSCDIPPPSPIPRERKVKPRRKHKAGQAHGSAVPSKANTEFVSSQQQLLFAAVKERSIGKVKVNLCSSGVNLNQKDEDGYTILSTAIYNADIAIVKILLDEQNIDVNMKDGTGNTPLTAAVIMEDINIVNALLARKDIDEQIRNNKGQLPFSIVSSINPPNEQMLLAFTKRTSR